MNGTLILLYNPTSCFPKRNIHILHADAWKLSPRIDKISIFDRQAPYAITMLCTFLFTEYSIKTTIRIKTFSLLVAFYV